MKQRRLRNSDEDNARNRDRDRDRDRFDPIAAGARLGLSPATSLAIWDRIRDGRFADPLGDPASEAQRFERLAARVAADGDGSPGLAVGKLTRTADDAEAGDGGAANDARWLDRARAANAAHRTLAESWIPGRQTLLTAPPRRSEAAVSHAPGRRTLVAVELVAGQRAAQALHALRAPVMRRAEAGEAEIDPAVEAEIQPGTAELIARARSGGEPLEVGLRSRLEASLRTRLDDVRIHTGADADVAARAIGARAFAVGHHVMFRAGAYDPHGRDGQHLIAHEVAHTVQARGGSAATGAAAISQPGDRAEREADAFADRFVHETGRGEAKADAAGASSSGDRTSAPGDRTAASGDRTAAPATTAAHRAATPAAAPAAAPVAPTAASRIFRAPDRGRSGRMSRARVDHPEISPETAERYEAFLRGVYAAAERIISKNIEAVTAWRSYVMNQLSPRQMTAQVYATGFEQLEDQAAAHHAGHLLAPYSAEHNPIRQSIYEHQMAGEWRACTGCHMSNHAWALDSQMRATGNPGISPGELLSDQAGMPRPQPLESRIWTDPEAWRIFAPPSRPQPGQPASHAHSTPARRQAASPEASLAAAREAVAKIGPQLQPLGDRGYKIIPSNLISRFGQAPVSELRAELETAFARRLTGYGQLLEKIRGQRIEYLEFDSLVALLKPMAAPDVQAVVDTDIHRRHVREIVTFVGMLVVDLISIVVPPVALLAGALHVVHGIDQMQTGADRTRATGLHGVMSPEQQASGAMMQAAGSLEVLGGAVQAGAAVAGLRGPTGSGSRGGPRVVARTTQGSITIEVLENRVIRATHAGYPGKSVVMQPDGTFQALDEAGAVVGHGTWGDGGAQAAANQAWGSPGAAPAGTAGPAGPAAAPAPRAIGPGPAGPASPTSASPTSASPATAGPGAASSTALAPVSPAMSQWPEVSPFYVGGTGEGTFAKNQYNTCGRGDNCGFTSMSYARSRIDPAAQVCSAQDLYEQRLQQLGISLDENLSQQLVFPERSYDGLRSRPGYDPLFSDGGGNRLSEYTLPSTARALGIAGTEANDAMKNWEFAFGEHASLEDAVASRTRYLEARGAHPKAGAVQRWIEAQRAELPGLYIVGSRSSAHYLTIEISPTGQLTGFDPQNLAQYPSAQAVQARMGRAGFDMVYKVTGAMPPPSPSTPAAPTSGSSSPGGTGGH